MRKAVGSFGDVNPIEHGGGVVFTNEYGPAFFAFRKEGDIVITYCVHMEDDAMADLDWADWPTIAVYSDRDLDEMRRDAKSDNLVTRAQIYAAVGDYHGYLMLDETPQHLTVEEAESKFADLLEGCPPTAKTVSATVTPYEGDAQGPSDWAAYVAEQLQEEYPQATVEVNYGSKNVLFVDGEPDEDFAGMSERWWDELCSDSDHEQWQD